MYSFDYSLLAEIHFTIILRHVACHIAMSDSDGTFREFSMHDLLDLLWPTL